MHQLRFSKADWLTMRSLFEAIPQKGITNHFPILRIGFIVNLRRRRCYRYCIERYFICSCSATASKEHKDLSVDGVYTFVCVSLSIFRLETARYMNLPEIERVCIASCGPNIRKHIRLSTNRCFMLQKHAFVVAPRALHSPVFACMRELCIRFGRVRVYVHICIYSGYCPLQIHLQRAFMVFNMACISDGTEFNMYIIINAIHKCNK